MFATINAPAAVIAAIAAMLAEDAYYDTPEGYRVAEPTALNRMPAWLAKKLSSDNALKCGQHHGPCGAFAWLKSSGAWAVYDPAGGVMQFAGTRQQFSAPLWPDIREVTNWTVEDSLFPDLPPWEDLHNLATRNLPAALDWVIAQPEHVQAAAIPAIGGPLRAALGWD
jgi:hypothetical protein